MPLYRTSHDLARVMGQSDETARRVLREVFGDRDEPNDWRLSADEWLRVYRHVQFNDERQFGRRRHHEHMPKPVQFELL